MSSEVEEEEYESPSLSPAKSPVDDESLVESVGANVRAHLMHNGKWKGREYNVGRLVKGTGVWYRLLSLSAFSL